MLGNYIELKIGKMRKPQSFLVQNVNVVGGGKTIILQSSKAIGQLDAETGAFKFNPKGCYFHHLAFAQPVELAEELKEKILELAGGEA